MSTVRVLNSVAVGLDGRSVWLEAGEEYPVDATIVKARPELFGPGEAESEPKVDPKRRGRSG